MQLNELKAEIVRNGLTVEEFADITKIGRTTMWRRFKNPGDFTLNEIKTIASVLKLNTIKIKNIFFGV